MILITIDNILNLISYKYKINLYCVKLYNPDKYKINLLGEKYGNPENVKYNNNNIDDVKLPSICFYFRFRATFFKWVIYNHYLLFFMPLKTKIGLFNKE